MGKYIATIRKHRPDYTIVVYMGILMMIGLVVMYAIGPQRANIMNKLQGSEFSVTYFFIKQFASLVLSLMSFGFFYLVSIKIIRKYAFAFLIFGFGASLLLAVASFFDWGIAKETLGATRWFDLGSFGTLQPSEILKLGLLFFLSGFLANKAKEGKLQDKKETLYPVLFILILSLLFVVILQKDLGTGVAISSIILSVLFMAGIDKKVFFGLFIGMIVLAILLIIVAPHRMARIGTFLEGDNTTDIENAKDAGSYHIYQSKLAIGSGGLMGVGIGNSVQATGYLPEAINDSVFAILGETFGFVGLVMVIFLFSGLLMRLLKISDNLNNDIFLKLVVAGVFGWIGSHFILNVAAMIGVAPLTGITLPLLSYGGTSMIFITAGLAMAFRASCFTNSSISEKEAKDENSSNRGRIGRSRNSSSRRSA